MSVYAVKWWEGFFLYWAPGRCSMLVGRVTIDLQFFYYQVSPYCVRIFFFFFFEPNAVVKIEGGCRWNACQSSVGRHWGERLFVLWYRSEIRASVDRQRESDDWWCVQCFLSVASAIVWLFLFFFFPLNFDDLWLAFWNASFLANVFRPLLLRENGRQLFPVRAVSRVLTHFRRPLPHFSISLSFSDTPGTWNGRVKTARGVD